MTLSHKSDHSLYLAVYICIYLCLYLYISISLRTAGSTIHGIISPLHSTTPRRPAHLHAPSACTHLHRRSSSPTDNDKDGHGLLALATR
jgi:hypothetical protein